MTFRNLAVGTHFRFAFPWHPDRGPWIKVSRNLYRSVKGGQFTQDYSIGTGKHSPSPKAQVILEPQGEMIREHAGEMGNPRTTAHRPSSTGRRLPFIEAGWLYFQDHKGRVRRIAVGDLSPGQKRKLLGKKEPLRGFEQYESDWKKEPLRGFEQYESDWDVGTIRGVKNPYDRKGAIAYISRIKNDAKRNYAQMWFAHITQGLTKQDPSFYGISVLAAQAVRMQLEEFGVTQETENPSRTKIYSHIIEIKASKAGMPHKCNSACKRAGHQYVHHFKRGNPIYGAEGGKLSIG